jgi:hypothetical protein
MMRPFFDSFGFQLLSYSNHGIFEAYSNTRITRPIIIVVVVIYEPLLTAFRQYPRTPLLGQDYAISPLLQRSAQSRGILGQLGGLG